MAAHRYWEFWFYRAVDSSGFWPSTIAEFEMHTSIGGADVCTGGTPSIISGGTPGVAANAFDNDPNTNCHNSGFGGPWRLRYDFGAGNEKDIVEVSFTARNDANAANYSVKHGFMAYSDDGSNWYPAFSISDQTGWSAGETRTFSKNVGALPTTKTKWRLLVWAPAGGDYGGYGLGLRELQMRITDGGADQCTGGTATGATEPNAVSNAANAFDDDNTTSATASEAVFAWVAYEFTAAKRILQIAVTSAPGDFFPVNAVSKTLVEFYDATYGWKTAWEAYFGGAWGGNETRVRSWPGSVPGEPVITATADSTTAITVSHTTPGSGADDHDLYMSEDSSDLALPINSSFLIAGGLGATPANYQKTGLSPATIYYFRSIASNTDGETESAIVSATTPPDLGTAQIALITSNTANHTVTSLRTVIENLGYTAAYVLDSQAAAVDWAPTSVELIVFIESAISLADALTVRASGLPILSDHGTRLRMWSGSGFLPPEGSFSVTTTSIHIVNFQSQPSYTPVNGSLFIHYARASVDTVVGETIGMMNMQGGDPGRVAMVIEAGELDINGDTIPARMAVLSWMRLTGLVNLDFTASGIERIRLAIVWLLGGPNGADPVIQAYTGLGRSQLQIFVAGTTNHRLYRNGALIETLDDYSLGLSPTYIDNGPLTSLGEYCYQLVAYDPETLADRNSNISCITAMELYGLKICGTPREGEETWGTMEQYCEEEMYDEDHFWVCGGTPCPLLNFERGINTSMGNFRPGAWVLKYRPYDGGAAAPHAFPLAGSKSQNVRVQFSFGMMGWFIHPWLFNELNELGAVALASRDGPRVYGISAGITCTVIDQGVWNVDPCDEEFNPNAGRLIDPNLVIRVRAPYYETYTYIPLSFPIFARRLGGMWTCSNCGYGVSLNTMELYVEQMIDDDPSGKTYYVFARFFTQEYEHTYVLPSPLPCGFGGAYIYNPGFGDIYVSQMEIGLDGECVTSPPEVPTEQSVVATLTHYVSCGNLRIVGTYVPDGADQFASADLEIIRLDTNTIVYSEYEVATLFWFFGQGQHNLPYDVPLKARFRVRSMDTPPVVSEWVELELGELEWCLELIAIPGRRRILFGEVGETSEPLTTVASPKRRILIGQVGEEELS